MRPRLPPGRQSRCSSRWEPPRSWPAPSPSSEPLRVEYGSYEDAVDLCTRAVELAERLDLPDVLSDALDTEAYARVELEQEWLPTLRRALQIALDAGLEEQAGRAYANMSTVLVNTFQHAEAEQVIVEAMAYCDEHDVATYGNCVLGARGDVFRTTGRWDEAVALSNAQMAKPHLSPVNRLQPMITLGWIGLRRGDPAAWDLLDAAAAAAESLGEPSWLVATRLARAEGRWLAGQDAETVWEVQQALANVGTSPWSRGQVAVWVRRLDAGPVPDFDVAAPYEAELRGDLAAAARTWDDLGCPYEAAISLLHGPDEAYWREALERFEALGAVATAALARRRMRGRASGLFRRAREPQPVSTRSGSPPVSRRSSTTFARGERTKKSPRCSASRSRPPATTSPRSSASSE
jgi:tetratricopeptide (TPR) repeat protein